MHFAPPKTLSFGQGYDLGYALTNGVILIVFGITTAPYIFFPSIFADLDAEREFVSHELKQAGKTEHDQKVRHVKPQISINFLINQFFADGEACVISTK
jgi:hypothetical protein